MNFSGNWPDMYILYLAHTYYAITFLYQVKDQPNFKDNPKIISYLNARILK